MPSDVGINISVKENLSTQANKMSDSLRNVSRSAEDMVDAFDLGGLEEKYKSFAERVDKIYDMQRAGQDGGGAGDGRGAGRRTGPEAPYAAGQIAGAGTQAIRAAGTTVQGLGQTGEAAGAGANVLGVIGGLLKSIGPIGWGLAAVGGVAAGGVALARQYEEKLPGIMALSAALGRLADDAKETSLAFKDTMKEASEAAAEFGYTLEEGIKIYQTIAKEGGWATREEARAVGAYARGYGVETEPLARFQAMGRRFGQTGNLLGTTAGGLEASGMGPGRFQEYLNATLAIFEEGLSRGVVKGFTEISATQNWLAQLGTLFTGQTGLNIYRKMEATVTGATSLNTEQDAMLFRAARKTMGKNVGYVDVMKKLEMGIDAKMFDEIKGYVQEMSGNREDQIEMMRSIFGVSYTTADELLTLKGTVGAARVKQAEDISGTPEIRLLKAQQTIMEDIREAGSAMVDAHAWVLEGASKVVDTLNTLLGGDVEKQKEKEEKKQRDEKIKDAVKADIERAPGELNLTDVEGYVPLRSEFANVMTYGLRGGVGSTAANKMKSMFENLSSEQRASLSDWGGNKETGLQGSIFDYLALVAWQHKAPGETQAGFVPGDLPVVLEKLVAVLDSLGISVGEDKNLNITVEEEPMNIPAGELTR